MDFSGGSDSKEFTCNAGKPGSIPEMARYLGKEMAAHSSILAWRIPWTVEPGRLQSMVLQRVGYRESQGMTNTFTFSLKELEFEDLEFFPRPDGEK